LTPASLLTRMALRRAFYDPAKVTDSLIELYAKYQRIPGTIYALMWTVRNFFAADIDSVRRSLSQIQIPVLNIIGEHDRIVPRSTAEALSKLLPQCRLEIIDGVGHIPQEESPEAVIQLIRKFVLAQIGQEASAGHASGEQCQRVPRRIPPLEQALQRINS
jgi:pimeloyl-ACP methyl ester carboxylesterase